jgi:hypothetical protein
MWEITLICGANRGNGGMLLNKLKAIASYYDLPITLYGMGTKRGSRQLYERNGFHLESDSYRFIIDPTNSVRRSSSSPRRQSSTRRIRRLTDIKSSHRSNRRRNSNRTSVKRLLHTL